MDDLHIVYIISRLVVEVEDINTINTLAQGIQRSGAQGCRWWQVVPARAYLLRSAGVNTATCALGHSHEGIERQIGSSIPMGSRRDEIYQPFLDPAFQLQADLVAFLGGSRHA